MYHAIHSILFIYVCVYIKRGREGGMGERKSGLITTLIMAQSIFFNNTPFPHSQGEDFTHIELFRLRRQHNCMGCWKVSLLMNRELCYTASHCASLCPQYFSSSSLLASASLSSFWGFVLLPVLSPHPSQINYYKGCSGLSMLESNLEVILTIHSFILKISIISL